MNYVRRVFVHEDTPEFAGHVPEEEWTADRDVNRLAQMLNDSATTVRDAVRSRLESGQGMEIHYDHPILMLQHMIWHAYPERHGRWRAVPAGRG